MPEGGLSVSTDCAVSLGVARVGCALGNFHSQRRRDRYGDGVQYGSRTRDDGAFTVSAVGAGLSRAPTRLAVQDDVCFWGTTTGSTGLWPGASTWTPSPACRRASTRHVRAATSRTTTISRKWLWAQSFTVASCIRTRCALRMRPMGGGSNGSSSGSVSAATVSASWSAVATGHDICLNLHTARLFDPAVDFAGGTISPAQHPTQSAPRTGCGIAGNRGLVVAQGR